jgi:hypothetical protein
MERSADDKLIEPLSAPRLAPNASHEPVSRVAQRPLLVIIKRVEALELRLEGIVHDLESATLFNSTDSLLDHRACRLEPPNDCGGRARRSGKWNERAKSPEELLGGRFLPRQLNGVEEPGKPALFVDSAEVLGPEQKVENVEDRVGEIAGVDTEFRELCDVPFV